MRNPGADLGANSVKIGWQWTGWEHHLGGVRGGKAHS